MTEQCFDCGDKATHRHHVVPRSLGGTRTVSLCHACHGKAHGRCGFRDIATLTKSALDYKRAKGERVGGIPYGYQLAADGVHLEANPDELRAVELVRERRAEGLTLRAIASRLEAAGYVPRGGSKWHPDTVARIVAVSL